MNDEILHCTECELGVEREKAIETFGLVGAVRCACGALVKLKLRDRDLPRFCVDEAALGRMSSRLRKSLVTRGAFPGEWQDSPSGHDIAADTPMWQLFGPAREEAVEHQPQPEATNTEKTA